MAGPLKFFNMLILAVTFFNLPFAAAACIGVVTAGGGQEFWQNVIRGANKAAEELNIKIYARGAIDEINEGGQRRIIDSAIKLGCTGLVLAPNSEQQKEVVKRLKARGIPTVFIDRDIGGERISVIKTENFSAGEQAAKEMAKALHGKGKIALLRMDNQVTATTAREDGFIKAATAAGLEIVIDQYIGTRIGEARSNAYQLLKKPIHNIDGIFTPNESTSLAVIKTLEQLDQLGKITHIGFDAPKIMISALKSQRIYGFMVQAPLQMGYLGVYTVHDALQGKTVQQEIHTDAVFISRENINHAPIREILGLRLSE